MHLHEGLGQMDFVGSMQTALFAYGLMAAVSTLAALMVVQGIVSVVQRTQKQPQAALVPVPISVTAADRAVLRAHLAQLGDAGRAAYGRTTYHTFHAPRRSGR